MILAHLTDIHLDFLKIPQILEFCTKVNESGAGCVLLTGDISNGNQLITHLCMLSDNMRIPIYFCCGNHDFWSKSFSYIRKELKDLHRKNLIFLDTAPVITLSDSVGLIGHTGWMDLLNGNVDKSHFFPNAWPDFSRIGEFSGMSAYFKKQICLELTQTACDFLEKQLLESLKNHSTTLLGTHFPVYRESSWHLNKICDDASAPFFTNKIIGEMLTRVMSDHPSQQLFVHAGHSHSRAFYKPLPNISVIVGAAEYGDPSFERFVY